jgi:SNF2 family DNA or RNA helicase
MGYKVGNLTGTRMWNESASDQSRDEVVERLNSGSLDGIVMTAQVGACGHNLTGASRMLFIGSEYSKAREDQAVGNYSIPDRG